MKLFSITRTGSPRPSEAASYERAWISRCALCQSGSSDDVPLAQTHPGCFVHVVTAENRNLYEDELEVYFQLRHHVYVKERGWESFRSPTGREVDQYDSAETIYLLALEEETRRLVGGARLVPTIKGPPLAGMKGLSTFSIPRSPFIYHVSRIITAPDRREYRGLNLVGARILCGVQEYCLAEDIEQLTLLVRTSLLPQYLELGWDPQPLGLPTMLWGASLIPIMVDVNENALNVTRLKRSIAGSVLVRRGITFPAITIRPPGGLN